MSSWICSWQQSVCPNNQHYTSPWFSKILKQLTLLETHTLFDYDFSPNHIQMAPLKPQPIQITSLVLDGDMFFSSTNENLGLQMQFCPLNDTILFIIDDKTGGLNKGIRYVLHDIQEFYIQERTNTTDDIIFGFSNISIPVEEGWSSIVPPFKNEYLDLLQAIYKAGCIAIKISPSSLQSEYQAEVAYRNAKELEDKWREKVQPFVALMEEHPHALTTPIDIVGLARYPKHLDEWLMRDAAEQEKGYTCHIDEAVEADEEANSIHESSWVLWGSVFVATVPNLVKISALFHAFVLR